MSALTDYEEAVELLQQLGLKEYEAKCFVTLARMPSGTAKSVSDASDVPRTRVYDAVRVLEAEGLVEVQHGSPQRFRAVSTDEAVATLTQKYEARMDDLRRSLRDVEPVDDDGDQAHEVWALTGSTAISNRTQQLAEQADRELVLVVGSEETLSASLVETLEDAMDRGVDLFVGAVDETVYDALETELPGATVFVSGLEWLDADADGTAITRLMLIDRNAILVSVLSSDATPSEEHAVFGTGFSNGLVVIARRLMATGLLPEARPQEQ